MSDRLITEIVRRGAATGDDLDVLANHTMRCAAVRRIDRLGPLVDLAVLVPAFAGNPAAARLALVAWFCFSLWEVARLAPFTVGVSLLSYSDVTDRYSAAASDDAVERTVAHDATRLVAVTAGLVVLSFVTFDAFVAVFAAQSLWTLWSNVSDWRSSRAAAAEVQRCIDAGGWATEWLTRRVAAVTVTSEFVGVPLTAT